MDNSEKQQPNNSRTRGLKPRWKKGESGNPAGRPPKLECITSLVKEKLEQNYGQGKTYAQLVADTIIKLSLEGNTVALKELLDRVEGRVVEKHQVEARFSKVELVPHGGDNVNRGSEEDVSA